MKFIKKYFKLFIGIAVLIFVIVVFVGAQRGNNLESGTLKDWRAASLDRRMAAAQIITATSEHNDLMVACVDKMATLPDSSEMAIRDALSLCYTGMQLKESM